MDVRRNDNSGWLGLALQLGVGVIALVLVGWSDWKLGGDISVLPFYIAPVLVMAWARPGLAWFCLALVAAGSWCVAQSLDHTLLWSWGILIWNTLGRLGVFVCLGLLASLAFHQRRAEGDEDLDACGLLSSVGLRKALAATAAGSAASTPPSAVLMIEVEGHAGGTPQARQQRVALLAALLAGLLREKARDGDYIARLNDFDFALIMPKTALAQAELVASAVLGTLPKLRADSGQSFTATSVLGWSETLPATDADLLRQAGRALVLRRVTTPESHEAVRLGPASMAGLLAT